MKKRTLFSLALASVLMVGCQQDELVNVNDATDVNLGNRPELGSVILSTDDPTTRMILNTNNGYSFKWEEGDKLGAAIVDVPVETAQSGHNFDGGNNYSNLSWTYQEYSTGATKDFTSSAGNVVKVTAIEAGVDIEKYYTIHDFISTNYPYIRKGQSWITSANLSEGNYVFYAPYNQSHLTRKPLVVTLPMEQDCTDKSSAVSAFYKGTDIVALGNAFLAAPANPAEIISPSVKMTNIFAYPEITIRNKFEGYLFKGEPTSEALAKYTMKLKKIEIYTDVTGHLLQYKSALDADQFKQKVANSWDATKKEDGTGIFTTGVTGDILKKASAYSIETYPEFATASASYATKYKTTTDYISGYKAEHITCDLGGKELMHGEEYKFFAVMPAEDYGKKLFAKVYVEIDGAEYIILTSTADLTVNGGKATAPTLAALNDYNFRDAKHGDQGVRLVRGQRFPAAEVLEDASATKDFAGTLMTIELTGGKREAAYAMATEVVKDHYGIRDNADFIEHITKNVQRGVSLIEKNTVEATERSEWDATDIAFATDNTVTINAELIKALYNRLYDQRPNGAATGDLLTLNATKLPIAKDVKVEFKAGTTYTFTTLDGKTSYDIDYGTLIGNTVTALVNGINTGNGNLTIANGTTGAVVFLTPGASTLTTTTGISAITVPSGATLTVNGSTDALIVLNGGTITMGANGALTNPDNILSGTIDNSNFKTIAGNTTSATVKATTTGWPTFAIPASTKVNALRVNLGTAGVLAINTAEVTKLADLSNVAVTLGASVTGIKSSTSVMLTNIKSMTSETTNANIEWSTTANAITIICGSAPTTFFTKIAAATIGVSFVE